MSVVPEQAGHTGWDDEEPAGGLDESFERVPPGGRPDDILAAEWTLGGMLLSKAAIGDVVETLRPRDFYRRAHATIYDAILALYVKDEPADPITVADELRERGELDLAGGPGYLHTLVNSVPTAANADYYAAIVHKNGVLRRLGEAGAAIGNMSRAGEGDIDAISQKAQATLYEALSDRTVATPYAAIGNDVENFLDDLEALKSGTRAVTGLSTGFADLDALTSGLHPGQMIVVGARPAMGKSTLALDIARACAIHQGKPAAFFSLEMDRKEITQRTYSAEARVALHHIRSGTVTDDDWNRLARRTPDISNAPLVIDDSPDLTVLEIRSRARRIAQQYGELGLIVVDYLQLMTPGGSKRYGNRQEEVSEMSRNLKLLGKELGAPVIALSQLNRGPEQRQDKKPLLSDLRESGSIEQDADVVILLHREDAYEKTSPRAGEADLIIAKHRGGPTATVTVAFQGHYSRFVDMTRDMG